MVGVAVKVTEPPLHIEVLLAITDTEGTREIRVTVTGILPLSHPLNV